MVVVHCPVTGCSYKTDDQEPTIVSALLQLHASEHCNSRDRASGPKLERPRIDAGVSQEVWNAFVRRWEAYKAGSRISDDIAAIQLFQCASEELKNILLSSYGYGDISTRSLSSVLAAMRLLAVIPVARGVTRAELMRMVQANDESFRTFAARVRGKAETCAFSTIATCACDLKFSVDYTEEAIRDVVLSGIRSPDIRREALSTEGLQDKPINGIIAFVEGREMANKAVAPASNDFVSLSAAL